IGFLEQLLINLTIRVPPQPAEGREPSRRRPWHQGPEDADYRWNLFSMYCRPVGQVIFANWLATTSAMSGKSPIHSSRRLVPGSLSAVSEARAGKMCARARWVARFRYSDLKEAARGCGGRGCYANSIEEEEVWRCPGETRESEAPHGERRKGAENSNVVR